MEEAFLDNDVDFQTAAEMINLDKSLLKAAVTNQYMFPTVIQSKLFEIFPDRKHLIIKSKSRSGKTSGSMLLSA